jgi:hypothetical protein
LQAAASGTTMPPNITQVIKLANSEHGVKPIQLKLKVTHTDRHTQRHTATPRPTDPQTQTHTVYCRMLAVVFVSCWRGVV